LWKGDDKNDDNSGNPEQGDAQRASFLALVAPDVQLDEADAQQDCRNDE